MESSKWYRTLLALFIAPLVVGVVSGLIVELMKSTSGTPSASTAPAASTDLTNTNKPDSQNAKEDQSSVQIFGKWYSKADAETLEFFPSGKGLLFDEAQKPINFKTQGEHVIITVPTEPGKSGEVIVLNPSELVVAWTKNGLFKNSTTTVRYGRASNALAIGLSRFVFWSYVVSGLILIGGSLMYKWPCKSVKDFIVAFLILLGVTWGVFALLGAMGLAASPFPPQR